tara:strand:- start:18 stop:233 length:216 start_codon:yes stop_codon:yes gene_type:complete
LDKITSPLQTILEGHFLRKMAANNILKIRTVRGVPKYLYNIDKERYGDQYRTIKKIEKAKKKKKKNKKYNA